MRTILFAATIFLLIIGAVRADIPTPKLRVPSADEYLAAVPGIVRQWMAENTSGDFLLRDDMYGLMWQEMSFRYSPLEDQNFARLYVAYSAIDRDAKYTELISFYDRDRFNLVLLLAWLRQKQVDLSHLDDHAVLTYGDHQVQVTPRDFNADGQNEWILDVAQDGCADFHPFCIGDYRRLLVVAQTVAGDYQPVDARLFSFNPYSRDWLDESGFIQELDFKDLNQDGLPEWILALGGYGGGGQNLASLYILQWNAGRLVNLASHIDFAAPGGGRGLLPYGVTLEFGAKKIIAHQRFEKSRGCALIEHHIFRWDGTVYRLSLTERLRDSASRQSARPCNVDLPQIIPPPAPESPVVLQPVPPPEDMNAFYVTSSFGGQDYAGTIQRVDRLMRQEVVRDFASIWIVYYYRAMALEALHRDDEAAAEYAFIADHAPSVAWRMLAALHLQSG